jgi:hypothetical protein
MKYLCGVLNSKLLSFIFTYTSNKIEAESFPRLSVKDLKMLPIKNIDFSNNEEFDLHNQIVSLVEQIQNELIVNEGKNITTLECEVDKLVYVLYNLTVEEIEIVESSFSR